MNGFNTRFHNAGFDVPKYLLPWGNKTILYEIIKNIKYDGQIILVANKRDIYFKSNLLSELKDFDLNYLNVIHIDDTLGQAHTAAITIDFIKNQDEPMFVHNCDTILYGRDLNEISKILEIYEGYVDLFLGDSTDYCFAQTNEDNICNIKEKKQISPLASSGLYGFKNAKIYEYYYNHTKFDRKTKEIYISKVLETMLSEKTTIKCNKNYSEYKTIVLGSPKEYILELNKIIK